MIVKIDRSFEKDTNSIKNKQILHKIADCIERVEKSNSIKEVTNLKKLKGTNQYFRIRIGDYRIGLVIKGNTVIFERVLHRKDIYKKFP